MFFAVARFDLHVPQSRSLKEKRAVLNHIKARLSRRFEASVSEVDHQDYRQRIALGFALVVHRESSGRDALAAARRVVEEDPRIDILSILTHVGKLDEHSAQREETLAPDLLDWRRTEEDDEIYARPRETDVEPSRRPGREDDERHSDPDEEDDR